MATNHIYILHFSIMRTLDCLIVSIAYLISESVNSLTVFIQFIVLMSFPMVFSIELIYKIGGYFYPVHYPANAIYFSGLLIIAVFEVSAVYFCSAT